MPQSDDEGKTCAAGAGDGAGPAASCPCRTHWKLGVLILVAVMAAMVLAAKQRGVPAPAAAAATAQSLPDAAPAARAGLPRLLELGSASCIPCQMMAGVLDQLRQEYAGKLQVDFIDVLKHQEFAQTYGIRAMPTQILFDAAGKEVFRHEGFYPKDDILAKWAELGVDLNAAGTAASGGLQSVRPD